MNPNVQKWVADLRSGNYKQGHSFLRRYDKWCCLGVACDTAARCGVSIGQMQEGSKDGVIQFNETESYLPEAVREWLGAKSRDPWVLIPEPGEADGEYPLSELNDNDQLTFDQIADLIEAGLVEGL